jgi:hypothetical protein
MEEILQRIEKTVAMILLHDMKDAPQADKAVALNKAGFNNADIAALLGTSPAVINQQLYAARKAKTSAKNLKTRHC